MNLLDIRTMRKYLTLIFAVLFISQIVKAQEHYITNLYVYDLFLMNPAAAGGDRSCNKIDAYYQNQWQGMDDSPTSQVLSYQFGTSKLGSGTYIYNDANGYTGQFGFQQSLSYEVTLTNTQRHECHLSFGLSFNANQVSIDETSSYDGGTDYDPIMTGGIETGWGINSNTGFLLKYDHSHFGIALTNLFGQTNSLYEGSSANELPVDFHFHVGTWFKMSGRDIYFYPELMYRTNKLADSRFDANMKLKMPTYNENLAFWGILCYRRSVDADYGKDLSASLTFGINIGAISCGLEYQQGFAGAQSYYGNGFQLAVGYRFGFKDPSKSSIPCSFQDVYYDGYKSKGHKSGKHKTGRLQ